MWWNNKRLLLTVAVTLGISIFSGGGWFYLSQLPIRITPETIQLGVVRPGDLKTMTALITNTRLVDATITSLSSSCGCTEITIDGKKQQITIPARKTVRADIKFDGSMHASGDEVNHTLYVQVSQPRGKEYVVNVIGSVR